MRLIMGQLIVFVVMCNSASLLAAPELKGSPDELRSFLQKSPTKVTVRGYAEESAYADVAIVTLIIATENKQMSAALSANSSLRAAISKGFVAAGIAPESINTSKFSTSPQFGWFGDKPKSYEIVNRMKVEISGESQLKAVASAADLNIEIDFSDIEFKHTQKEQLKTQLLQEAIDDVMSQKKFYEDQLGLQLVPVSFTAPDVSVPARRAASRSALEEITVTARKRSDMDEFDASVPVTFDEIEYSARVSVVFEIVSAD
jgi:uncharacterized protein YggE